MTNSPDDISSSSAFVDSVAYSAEWTDVRLLQRRSRNVIYSASRYGRRFLLKGLTPEASQLSDYRLQQEKEFRLGISVVHPHIAATYTLEEVDKLGRCIVQEYIEGLPLSQWLDTSPSTEARKRVLDQLLDALDYLHQRQLVHHDLKSGNILVTRNGANVKLIDFGLSATDATLSPVPNDVRSDIRALGRLMPSLMPRHGMLARRCRNGRYATVSDIRRAISYRQRLLRMLPVLLSVMLLAVAAILFYVSWHERHQEQQRYEAMMALIDTYMAQEREQITVLVNRPDSFDSNKVEDAIAYSAYIDEYTAIRRAQWLIRDSIMAAFDENDPLREQFFLIWTRKELETDNELYPQITGKRY